MNKAILFIVIGLFFIASGASATVSTTCDPSTSLTSCAGKECSGVGTTTTDLYQTEILACLYNSTNAAIRELVWVSTTKGKGIGNNIEVFDIKQDWEHANGLPESRLLVSSKAGVKFNFCVLSGFNTYRHGINEAGGQMCTLTLDSAGNYTLNVMGASGKTSPFEFTSGGNALTICEATCYYD